MRFSVPFKKIIRFLLGVIIVFLINYFIFKHSLKGSIQRTIAIAVIVFLFDIYIGKYIKKNLD